MAIIFVLTFSHVDSTFLKNTNKINSNDQWEIKMVDSFGEVGYYSDITISDEVSYISYFDSSSKNLKISKIENDKITRETIDSEGEVGYYTSIDSDSKENLHISYYDKTNGDLKYAFYKDNKWNIKNIDTEGDTGLDTSICIDSNDNPHISYYDKTNGDLKYAFYTNNNWIIETVDTNDNTGLETSIAIDDSDNPHISYKNNIDGYLYYAYKQDNNWIISSVDTDCIVSGSTSIALDKSNNPNIIYYDVKPPNENRNLRHAYISNSEWNIDIIRPDLKHFYNIEGVGIKIDRFERIHVTFFNWEHWDLNYAYKIDKEWYIEEVDTEGMVGSYATIAIDEECYPHIGYMDNNNLALKYAKKIQYSPNKPEIPSGPNNCKLNTECKFSTKSYDFDDDKIRYKWDFGDGSNIDWSDYYNQGEEVEITHIWSENKIYQVRVKAEDTNGYESKWSDSLSVTVSKSKSINNQLLYFLEDYPQIFKIFKLITRI